MLSMLSGSGNTWLHQEYCMGERGEKEGGRGGGGGGGGQRYHKCCLLCREEEERGRREDGNEGVKRKRREVQ